jgi:hypothetical protein
MDKTVIVGGGAAGLLAVLALDQVGIEVVGVERGESLGADLMSGHHRLYRAESRALWEGLFPSINWIQIDAPAEEWRKGKWGAPDEKSLTEEQRYFLGSPFFVPTEGYRRLATELVAAGSRFFELHRPVQKIDPAARRLVFSDGSEQGYDKIVWCQSLESIGKVLDVARAHGKGKKKASQQAGGVILELDLRELPYDKTNTVLLDFRFKEEVLTALGNRNDFSSGDEVSFSWTLFLEESLLENREEVAKGIRAFKRELFKAFPVFKSGLVREKIVYLPLISGFTSLEVGDLSLHSDVLYLGSELRLGEPGIQNLDLLSENCRHLVGSVRPAGLGTPPVAEAQPAAG